MDDYLLKRIRYSEIPGLLKTDRAIIYLKQQLNLILKEVQQRTTKTTGDTYYRIARLRHELFPLLRLSGEHAIAEKIMEFTRPITVRTPKQQTANSIKALQNFLETYNTSADLNDEEIDGMRERLEQLEQQLADKDGMELAKVNVKVEDAKSVFVIMPFHKDFNDVWKGAIEKGIKAEGLVPVRVDMINKSSNITDDIIESIKKCKVAIIDVSTNNPNVMFELGYAVALNKPNIIISQSVEFLPFDIRNIRTIVYVNSWSGIEELRTKLQEFLREYNHKGHTKQSGKVKAKKTS